MITGVMLMTIMKITDDDWIVTMIIISIIILIMILKKFRNLK